jgi:hypothetical protein
MRQARPNLAVVPQNKKIMPRNYESEMPDITQMQKESCYTPLQIL